MEIVLMLKLLRAMFSPSETMGAHAQISGTSVHRM